MSKASAFSNWTRGLSSVVALGFALSVGIKFFRGAYPSALTVPTSHTTADPTSATTGVDYLGETSLRLASTKGSSPQLLIAEELIAFHKLNLRIESLEKLVQKAPEDFITLPILRNDVRNLADTSHVQIEALQNQIDTLRDVVFGALFALLIFVGGQVIPTIARFIQGTNVESNIPAKVEEEPSQPATSKKPASRRA